jgi:hypothetical protein
VQSLNEKLQNKRLQKLPKPGGQDRRNDMHSFKPVVSIAGMTGTLS